MSFHLPMHGLPYLALFQFLETDTFCRQAKERPIVWCDGKIGAPRECLSGGSSLGLEIANCLDHAAKPRAAVSYKVPDHGPPLAASAPMFPDSPTQARRRGERAMSLNSKTESTSIN